ncbi:hypothetical protein, partial [Sporosarcina koreensis]
MSFIRKAGMWIAVMALTFSGFSMSVAKAAGAQDVTRGEFITAVVKALELELGDGSTTEFTDVDEILAPIVEAAKQNGLIKG